MNRQVKIGEIHMKKTIGILAHVDAGKTTFSEQLLYHTKSIKERGRVDHQNAFLDSHEIERQRGITVFADQATFEFGDSTYYLLDTPGHVDFSPEMERAVQVMDYAIIIVSAVEGVEGHTETVWNLLQKHQVPTFFFLNKTDRTGANVQGVLEDIRANLTKDLCDITDSLNNDQMNEQLIEFIAERDEELLEHYMEKGFDSKLWLEKLKTMIQSSQIFPCASGSALQDFGVLSFIEKFDLLTVTDFNEKAPFAGRVYKIRYDEKGTKLTFIKALSGTLSVRDELVYGDGEVEKITQLRKYNGEQFQQVNSVSAGELFAVTGLSNTSVGDGVGDLKETANYEMVPTLRSKIIFEPEVNVKEALKYFRILEAEDPSLDITWEERHQEIHIHVMGAIQLEVIEQIVLERFRLKVTFEQPEIIYKETIENEVIGYGHFEPLRHYAEVHLKLGPGNRNSGIQFESKCHTDDLSVGLQNLVRQHIFEREHHGLLTGSSVTDLKVTLLTGRAHNKHTSGGDFREATFRALRQGLEKAQNILLEPFYHFKIKVDIDHMGKVISDIQMASGQMDAPLTEGDKATITGVVPVANFMNYNTELASFTHGKGRVHLTYAGYQPCHNEQEVIERIGYDKNADPEYTSSSIFCSKGTGFSVKWDEAEKMMHCL
jgi:ribosomal protection tetracycline resistance protein